MADHFMESRVKLSGQPAMFDRTFDFLLIVRVVRERLAHNQQAGLIDREHKQHITGFDHAALGHMAFKHHRGLRRYQPDDAAIRHQVATDTRLARVVAQEQKAGDAKNHGNNQRCENRQRDGPGQPNTAQPAAAQAFKCLSSKEVGHGRGDDAFRIDAQSGLGQSPAVVRRHRGLGRHAPHHVFERRHWPS